MSQRTPEAQEAYERGLRDALEARGIIRDLLAVRELLQAQPVPTRGRWAEVLVDGQWVLVGPVDC